MWPSIAKVWPSHCDRFEGCLGFMYLDTLGFVTTGRGNLIDPIEAALGLPWLNKATSTIVGADAITAEWQRVKARQDMAPLGGGAFAKITGLFLSQPSVDALTARKLASNESALAAGPLAPIWSGLCADAQLACHSMAWALGPRYPAKYPKWTTAMLAGDWAGAAAECGISHPVNASILARNALNVRGFVWAATVANAGLDRSICWSMQELTQAQPCMCGSGLPATQAVEGGVPGHRECRVCARLRKSKEARSSARRIVRRSRAR